MPLSCVDESSIVFLPSLFHGPASAHAHCPSDPASPASCLLFLFQHLSGSLFLDMRKVHAAISISAKRVPRSGTLSTSSGEILSSARSRLRLLTGSV